MLSPNAMLSGLSDLDRAKLEWLLWEFDHSWTPEALNAQVEKLPADDRLGQVTLVELIKIDMERQWKAGSRYTVEHYLQRFPQLGTRQTVSIELLEGEYELRRHGGLAADLSDFERRFPGRVDQLKPRLAAAAESSRGQSAPQADVDTSRREAATGTKAKAGKKTPESPKRFGRYQIIQKLGEGAMGAVYLARDTELDRKVALKVLKFSNNHGDELVARFYQEARAAAALSHRNICPVYDIGQIDDTHYISMAFIEGRPLARHTRSDRLLSEQEIATLARKLALALEQAHSLGVVHRDLKPANVMIDERQEPVIMDFGLARQLDKGDQLRLTKSGIQVGSPAYMSPEQVEGAPDRVGPRSDVYSLGVILYELLTGKIPFAGPVTKVLAKILTEQPARPSELRPGLDPRLEAICLKMMARGIDDRYQSMQEVADALGRYLEKPDAVLEPDASREPATAVAAARPRCMRWRPRTTRIAIAAFIAVCVLLGVVLLFRTGYGTVRIEIDDPNLQVTIDGREITFGSSSKPVPLKHGDHQFAVKLDETDIPIGETVTITQGEYKGRYKLVLRLDGAEMISDRFTILKGKERALTLSLLPVPPAVAQGEAQPPEATPPPLAVAPFTAEQASEHQRRCAARLGVPVEKTNSLGMAFVVIPPGEFDMGTMEKVIDDLTANAREDVGDLAHPFYVADLPAEGPQYRAKVRKPFYLGVCEVTVGDFRKFAAATQYKTHAEIAHRGCQGFNQTTRVFDYTPEYNWKNPGFEQKDNHPVVCVSWEDAIAFCHWLGGKQGRVCRLPTEAEWEYACRAGTTTLWSHGDERNKLGEFANIGDASIFQVVEDARCRFVAPWDDGHAFTAPVGCFRANAFGLHDMHGNVVEWCREWYERDAYKRYKQGDLTPPVSGLRHAVRGGLFTDGVAEFCRSAFRRCPSWIGTEFCTAGFRVVEEIPLE